MMRACSWKIWLLSERRFEVLLNSQLHPLVGWSAYSSSFFRWLKGCLQLRTLLDDCLDDFSVWENTKSEIRVLSFGLS